MPEHKTSQASSKGDARVSMEDRARARRQLQDQLSAISRTAKGLGLSDFWLSRDRSDRSLVAMGHMFATRAEPVKRLFIDSHLPPDFIDRLNAAVEHLERKIMDQVFREGVRITATIAINKTCHAALSALQRLNPLMENLLRDDPPALRLWESARRVERYSGSRSGKPAATAESLPSINSGASVLQP